MGGEDDDNCRDPDRSWHSWFKPTDSRRIEAARSKDTRDDLAQQFERWIEQQDTETRHKLQQRLPQVREELVRQGKAKDLEVNPFVAFKSFVDDGFAAIAHIPSRMRDRARERGQAAIMEKEDKWRHWSGRNDTINYMDPSVGDLAEQAWPSLPKDAQERAREATLMLLNEAIVRNAHIPTYKLARLYCDPESRQRPGALGRFQMSGVPWLETDYSAAYQLGIDPPTWLSVSWFQYSPYSPVNLERHPHLGSFDTKWRSAFEDLLEATLDKPMTSEEKYGVRPPYFHPTRTWRGSGLDWMLSLQCRGILPPQLPSYYSGEHQRSPILGVPNPGRFSDLANAIEGKTCYEPDPNIQSLLMQVAIPPDTKSDQSQPTELDLYEQQTAHAGVCPDNVGAAIQEAVRQEQFGNTSSEHSLGRCPDDLGRAIQKVVSEEETEDEGSCPLPDIRALQDYPLQHLMQLERHNRQRLLREWEEEDERAQSDHCPEELGRQVQLASHEQQQRCPDETGREIGTLARQAGCSMDELLDEISELERGKLNDEDDDDEDELTPGELWTLEQQIRERQKQQRRDAAYRNYRSWITGTEGPGERPTHKAMARHWDRLERLSEHYDTRSVSPEAATSEDALEEKPVSTSMTTLTTRSADGSMTTKIVRDVRYADGRKETSESVHTSQSKQAESKAAVEATAKKGWFWS